MRDSFFDFFSIDSTFLSVSALISDVDGCGGNG
jgi:hypothetical protein